MISIGVIIPVYNAEMYLSECIESIINQTYKNLQIILVNDGSTDNSGILCDEYAKRDNRIKVIHKDNGGASSARNIGIKECNSEYITFMDSDDFWKNDRCMELVVEKINRTNPDILLHDIIKLYDNKREIYDKILFDEEYIISSSYENVISYLVKTQKFRTSAYSKVIKRKLIIDNDIFFKEGIIAEDIDWGLNLALKARTYSVLNEKFYMYRQREGSVTKTIKSKGVKDLWYVLSTWINKISKIQNVELKESLMSYIAYHYSILIGLVYLNDEMKHSDMIMEIKENAWVLDYSKNRKTKALKIMHKIIGIDASMVILGNFLKIKNKLKI